MAQNQGTKIQPGGKGGGQGFIKGGASGGRRQRGRVRGVNRLGGFYSIAKMGEVKKDVV